MEAIIADIRAAHRKRNYAMEQRKRADLSLLSYLRRQLGWTPDLATAERNRIATQAKDLVAIGERVMKDKEPPEADTEDYGRFSEIIEASIATRGPWDSIEKSTTKEMEALAKSLPVWPGFAEGIRGFGARSLAVIVGEAGDLGSYETHSKFWKRMGLAVMDGKRQGGLGTGASKQDWIEHGYSPARRSRMFVIGDVLVKQGDHYRGIYLARKEYERAKAEFEGKTVVPSAKIPKGRDAEFMSDGHVHRRAQRYMEKRLLRDLWQAWGRANGKVSKDRASVARPAEHREGDRAIMRVPPMAFPCLPPLSVTA